MSTALAQSTVSHQIQKRGQKQKWLSESTRVVSKLYFAHSFPGSYISAASAPYNQRALPPSNLATNPSAPDFPYNYHVYQVTKPLTVVGGPIAPWFGQPGLGAQFYTGDVGNIMSLIEQGYLEAQDPQVLISREQGCA
jgi:hypothetical protein